MPAVDWNLLQRITADSLRVYEAIRRAQKMSDETERILRLSEDLLRQAALAYLTENALPEAAPNPTAPVEAVADAWVQVQQAYADLKAALRSLARAKQEAGQWEESRTLLLALLHLDPEDADAAALLTEIYLRDAEAKFSESKWDEGRAILEQAMRSQPVDKKRCRLEILRSFVRAGDPNGLASYEPRVEKSPAFQRWVKASRELQDFEFPDYPEPPEKPLFSGSNVMVIHWNDPDYKAAKARYDAASQHFKFLLSRLEDTMQALESALSALVEEDRL
jgi:tetratricopeptide (TPR) repeat protein